MRDDDDRVVRVKENENLGIEQKALWGRRLCPFGLDKTDCKRTMDH